MENTTINDVLLLLKNNGFSAHSLGGYKRNILCVEYNGRKSHLYVKESNTPVNPWWGLNENQLAFLDKASIPWGVVFLLYGIQKGFVVPSHKIKKDIADGAFYFSKTDHKVHEKKIHKSYMFHSDAKMINDIRNLIDIQQQTIE